MNLYMEKIKEAESLLASVGVRKASGSNPKSEAKIKTISPPPTKSLSPYVSSPRAHTPSAPPPASHPSKKNDRPIYNECGRCGHTSANCFQRGHPQFNAEACRWVDSTNGKALLAQGIPVLPREKEEGRPGQGKDNIPFYESLFALTGRNPALKKHGLRAWVNCENYPIHCLTLIDTGALQASYVGKRMASRLVTSGFPARDSQTVVRGGVGDASECA
jgi:hypothetical protein